MLGLRTSWSPAGLKCTKAALRASNLAIDVLGS